MAGCDSRFSCRLCGRLGWGGILALGAGLFGLLLLLDCGGGGSAETPPLSPSAADTATVALPVADDPSVPEYIRNADNPHFKVLEPLYAPFVVDSLSRYADSTLTRGWLTLTKYAPLYHNLCSKERPYHMWVVLPDYFPDGQLLQIDGIAENADVVQFHFTVTQAESLLGDLVLRLDSTLGALRSAQ